MEGLFWFARGGFSGLIVIKRDGLDSEARFIGKELLPRSLTRSES